MSYLETCPVCGAAECGNITCIACVIRTERAMVAAGRAPWSIELYEALAKGQRNAAKRITELEAELEEARTARLCAQCALRPEGG